MFSVTEYRPQLDGVVPVEAVGLPVGKGHRGIGFIYGLDRGLLLLAHP